MATSIDFHPDSTESDQASFFSRQACASQKPDFVELLARSNFSFLLGASHPEELVEQSQFCGYQGLGICDLNGLYGVARGFREAFLPTSFEQKKFPAPANFRYHIGAEMTLPEGNVCLLPMNKRGYANLCRLITESKRPAPKSYSNLKDEQIFLLNDGLIACPLPPWNSERLERYRLFFQDRLYLPIWRDFTWDSEKFCQQAFQLEKQGYSLFVTQRPFFHLAQRKKLHDILNCLYHKCTLKEAEQILLPNSERRLHTLDELHWLWKDRPDLMQKTLEISERLQFSLKEIRYHYPQGFLPAGKTSTEFLSDLCQMGIAERFPTGWNPSLQDTLQKELALIQELEYEDYFLTLWEICEFARKKKILFQGRGSAANSIVCYLIGLTSVDPLKVSLLFERFISKERKEPPDIDIDFEHERREEVIQFIYQKYGSERAAMVCNVICYRARMALREVCRVLEVPENTVSEMVKFMGREGLRRLQENPQLFQKWGISRELFEDILELVSQLRGFPRHLGIHSGGFVMTENSLLESVPVEKASMEGRYVVQWNKDDIETLGLMKVDLLSLGMLSAIRKSLQLLSQHKKIHWELHQIPSEDPDTYQMIQKSDTIGVFQIESRAQMSLLPRLKPKNYYDLVIEVAIVRPGPIQGGMVHPYLKRRDGLEKPFYPHPKLIPILQRTLGVPLFQEQVMQVLSSVAGFSPGEADQVRRIMSNAWRKKSQMEGLKDRIFTGLRANGIPEDYIEKIYKTVEGFASYGFPESHAASFALLTYASCFLKCHFPDVFTCALLNSQPMGFYSPRSLIADAQRHGVKFQPLSVQFSEEDYTLEASTEKYHDIRVGLRSIYGLPSQARKVILEKRSQGLFQNLDDFIRRTQLRLPVLMKLAQAGALLDFGLSAREALWKLPSYDLNQDSLFSTQNHEALVNDRWQPRPANSWEELNREYNSTGFSLDKHPLQLLRPVLHRINQNHKAQGASFRYYSSRDLGKTAHGTWVNFVGLLSVQQRPPTAKGVSFLSLEDEHGIANFVLMPKVYEKYRLTLLQSPILEVSGKLERENNVLNVIVSSVRIPHHLAQQAQEEKIDIGQTTEKVIKPRLFH